MSTWTNVTDTVLEPGQPIRSVDIIAIKNNILAVPAGAANAPRVEYAALGSWYSTAGGVGTHARSFSNTGGTVNIGGTRAGSTLGGLDENFNQITPFTGTWRNMGASTRAFDFNVWQRIA